MIISWVQGNTDLYFFPYIFNYTGREALAEIPVSNTCTMPST